MKSVKFLVLMALISQLAIGGCKGSKKSAQNQSTENPTATVNQGGKHLLKYNPKVGTEGTLVMTIDANVDMEMMGQEINTTQKMEMASNLKVTGNTADKVTSSMKYKYFMINMDIPMMGNMVYDTRKDDNEGMMAEAMSEAFEAILDKEIVHVQDHTGKTISMEGMEEIAELQQGQANMNISSLMNMSQFPEKAIKVGDTWKRDITNKASQYAFDATYTLKKIENGKVYVDVDSEVSMSPEVGDEAIEGNADVSGKQTGTFIYDRETMWLIEALMHQDFDMTIEQMGMKLPMKMVSDITMVME